MVNWILILIALLIGLMIGFEIGKHYMVDVIKKMTDTRNNMYKVKKK